MQHAVRHRTDTVVDPGAMVIHFHNASFAHTAVVGRTRLVCIAPARSHVEFQRGASEDSVFSVRDEILQ